MKPLSPSQPHLIIMVGVPGSGKSFFAENFAKTFNAPHISYDLLLKTTNDKHMATQLFDYMIGQVIKTSQSVIVDGWGATRTERAAMGKLARTHGYEPMIIWVQTDLATAKSRLTKAGVGAEAYGQLLKRFTAPNSTEHVVVISGKHTYATQAKVVLQRLSAPRSALPVNTNVQRPKRSSGRSISVQ